MYTVLIVLALLLHTAVSQLYTGPPDPRLVDKLILGFTTVGVSTTPDGRIFLVITHDDGTTGPDVVEYFPSTNTSKPYPDVEWNSYGPGKDPATHYVSPHSQRLGPDGNLYVVDRGGDGFGTPTIIPGGPKLIQINLTTNAVQRVWSMDNATRAASFLDDVRFNPASGLAYLTDAGSPGLIVLDMKTGEARRVLDDALSAREYMPISGEGSIVYTNGKPIYVYSDQFEVSPDAKYLYFQPASGGLSRIETRYLDAAFYNSSMNTNAILEPLVEPFAHTPSSGGTAIDAHGNVYDSDTDSQRIIKIAPNGTMTTLVQDARLRWIDAMWIDAKGRLWMPATQLNKWAIYNNGTSKIVRPTHVYTIDIGVGPPRIDHA